MEEQDIRGFNQSNTTIIHPKKTKQNRVALVIGNADYQGGIRDLNNAVHDAEDMSALLKKYDFDVITVKNGDLKTIKKAVDCFVKKLSKTSKGKGLFYYAGHGVEIKKINYLIPVDAKIDNKVGLNKNNALNLQFVLDKIQATNNSLNIIILDSCRNNPFKTTRGFNPSETKIFKGDYGGFSSLEPPSGSLLAYATSPGTFALDGTGRNGVYTKYLLQFLKQKELVIEEVLKKVRTQVKKETNGKQISWEHTSLSGVFRLADPFLKKQNIITLKNPSIGKLIVDINNENTQNDVTENNIPLHYQLSPRNTPFKINSKNGIITLKRKPAKQGIIELTITASDHFHHTDNTKITIQFKGKPPRLLPPSKPKQIQKKSIYLSLEIKNDNYSLNQLMRFFRQAGFKVVIHRRRAQYQLKAKLKVMEGKNILNTRLKPISIDLDLMILNSQGDILYSFNSMKKVVPHINTHEAAKDLIKKAVDNIIIELKREPWFKKIS